MKRFIENDLKKWKERKRRKPLILRGARQVGKTYSVMRFGEDSFDNVAVVNLERNPEWIGCWVLGIGDWVLDAGFYRKDRAKRYLKSSILDRK